MAKQQSRKINKRLIETLKPDQNEYTIWDPSLPGFGIRVRPSGSMTFVFIYRVGGGRGAQQRRVTIGSALQVTPDKAREKAKALAGEVAFGRDPVAESNSQRETINVRSLADRFLDQHVEAKRKPTTAAFYRDIVERFVKPELGTIKIDKLTRADVAGLHHRLKGTPFQANRVLAAIGSMYTFADKIGLVAEDTNPARKIERYKEARRERFLSTEELLRLGTALKEAETVGLPWSVDETKKTAKHLPKKRRTIIGPHAIAAIRLLLFTGARLREILHLRWENVDFQRRLLFLPDSKTGKKTIVLNAPACSLLASLVRVGPYVIVGKDSEKPRSDLHRPWKMISEHAGLQGVRIHDLRHTHASVGAGAGFGLPIIGKLLGHTQASTTQRYAHLDNDPLQRASESIGMRLLLAMDGTDEPPDKTLSIVPLRRTGTT